MRGAGSLVSDSGVLTVVDLGYDNDDALPLARRVAPGTYPVQVGTAYGRNTALRVLLSPAEPVAWHPAGTVHGHVFGVDAGNLCVADYPSYAAVSRREKERVTDVLARTTDRPAVLPLTFGGEHAVGVVADSGWGDGAYPAFWGVDATGAIAQLVVDFLVLVTEQDGVLRHV